MLTSTNVIEDFLNIIPEIEDSYNELIEWWDNEIPGLHIVFGDVLNHFLIEQIRLNQNKELLNRIFGFLERMATSTDESIVNVLAVTILAMVGDDTEILKRAIKYMGIETVQVSFNVEKQLGRT